MMNLLRRRVQAAHASDCALCSTPGKILLAAVLSCQAGAGWSGGSPETTLLVVNADSPLSLAVANEYVRLRGLPERQVLWLTGVPPRETIDEATFRTRVLSPIREHLRTTGLEREIDLIAYSAGFPYAVGFRGDEKAAGLKPDRARGDAGSLTGMTFFRDEVARGGIAYLRRDANPYFRRPRATMSAGEGGLTPASGPLPVAFEPARGFRSRYEWTRGGADGAGRHVLSVMLAYTGLRGNSLPEIRAYLRRAAASDGTRPTGTVYLMDNPDVRARARRPMFPATLAALQARGRRAEILVQGRDGQNGREPVGKKDVVGVVAGTRRFDWAGSGSVMLPGAIAESFTSYGGHFGFDSQTKLSEFLRHGAAGSSGAVREPYAFAEKFPVPLLHVHYADGCSLAEAFYQSVANPYQLIVVGDPLARPFAQFAEVSLDGFADDQRVSGVVVLQPRVRPAPQRPVARVEFWIDGLPVGASAASEPFALDTRSLADGSHELRIVAVEAGPIETRSERVRRLWVDNHGLSVDIGEGAASLPHGAPLRLAGSAAGAVQVVIRQGQRVLAETPVRGGEWAVEVDSARLGIGPVTLLAVAQHRDGREVRSRPLSLEVGPPEVLLAGGAPPAAAGLAVRLERVGAAAQEGVVDGLYGVLPREMRGGHLARVSVRGAFEARSAGLHEMTVEAVGELRLRVGGRVVHEARVAAGDGGVRVALPLAAGWHRFELSVDDPGKGFPRVVLAGPEPAVELRGERVRHDGNLRPTAQSAR